MEEVLSLMSRMRGHGNLYRCLAKTNDSRRSWENLHILETSCLVLVIQPPLEHFPASLRGEEKGDWGNKQQNNPYSKQMAFFFLWRRNN